MAAEQSFEVFSGNDVVLKVTVVDTDSGLPLNLTGVTAIEWGLARRAAATPQLSKSLGSGVVVTAAVDGKLEITLDAADLEPLKDVYYHELRITNAAGKKATVLYGNVTVLVNLIRT